MHTRLTSQIGPAAFFPAAVRGESAPAAGLTHGRFREMKFCCASPRSVKQHTGALPRTTVRDSLSVGGDRDPSRIQRAWPCVHRRRGDAPHVWTHEVPAHRLRQKGHRRVTHQHLLSLLVFLVASVGLGVGPRDPHEVVVLPVSYTHLTLPT